MIIISLTLLAALGWILLFLLSSWRLQQRIDTLYVMDECDLSTVTVLMTGRNVEEHITQTLRALKLQGKNLPVIFVDDHSSDATIEKVNDSRFPGLILLPSQPLPEGWSNKFWLLQQGFAQVTTPYVLLLDADITLQPGLIATLVHKSKQQNLALMSLLPQLSMRKKWEKFLMPAHIYFFKLLHPLSWANSPDSRLAVAFNACMLIKTAALEQIGGFITFKSAANNSNVLVKQIKQSGYRTWVGLTSLASCHRVYPRLADIWRMMRRNAFAQLNHSWMLLLSYTLVLILLFVIPVVSLILRPFPSFWLNAIPAFAILAMLISYLPTLRYYHRNLLWSVFLPIAAVFYLLMTWSSALNTNQRTSSKEHNPLYGRG